MADAKMCDICGELYAYRSSRTPFRIRGRKVNVIFECEALVDICDNCVCEIQKVIDYRERFSDVVEGSNDNDN